MMIERIEIDHQLNYHQQQSVVSPAINQQYFQHQHQQQHPATSMLASYPIQSSQVSQLQQQQPRPLNNQLEIPNIQQQQSGHELIGYYFGSISRETAEWILKTHGNSANGAYLLRSSGPNDDFVLSLMVNHKPSQVSSSQNGIVGPNLEILHYKIIETEDSFVALHGQVGDEKFATIDELIDKAQGVATKPRWPILRQSLDSQILPPTYWGLSVDQVRLAILIKAKQWGCPLLSSLFHSPQQQQPAAGQNSNVASNVTTLNNETIRTLIYKSLHEFQPWFHGKISREDAERRIDGGRHRDGKFLVRERDNYSYAMCICHKRTTKHYRIDVLPTGELAIQDGRKFTSLMALISHYTIMNDGLWCALTEACPRPIATSSDIPNTENVPPFGPSISNINLPNKPRINQNQFINANQNLYCLPPINGGYQNAVQLDKIKSDHHLSVKQNANITCQSNVVPSLKVPIKEWLHTINHRWSQLMASKNHNQSLNSFLFGNQNPLNNHRRDQHHHLSSHRRKCKNSQFPCGCDQKLTASDHNCKQAHQTITPQTDMQVAGNHYLIKANENYLLAGANHKDVYNGCCNSTTCSTNRDTFLPQNQLLQSNSFTGTTNQSGSSLLYRLPQNSGFTWSSQSFIGSPLFAVKGIPADNTSSGARSGSNSSDSGSGCGSVINNNVDEEKLISPVQSVTGVSSNNQNHDIYGLQTSTTMINDTTQNSSTSNDGYLVRKNQSTQMMNMKCNSGIQDKLVNRQKPHQNLPQVGCQLLRAQHASPAYPYKNFNDENSFKPCNHRSLAIHRASDDSQLLNSSNQLVGPAAMTKFIQFQDGHCLRTHRDTQSIQLAYLSARQAPKSQRNQIQANQVPLREIKIQPNHLQYLKNNTHANISNLTSLSDNEFMEHKFKEPDIKRFYHSNKKDVDLMDWNEDTTFEFKYDPKMIKSSSIETLCGIETEDEINTNSVEDGLEEFKSNTELMMSLQSNWMPNSNNSILSPVPVSFSSAIEGNSSSRDKNEVLNLCRSEYKDSALLNPILPENIKQNEDLNNMRRKHDLDELTTALLAELTASLKAQVDLKNKQFGIGGSVGLQNSEKLAQSLETQHKENYNHSKTPKNMVEVNPMELINEFDSLISKSNAER